MSIFGRIGLAIAHPRAALVQAGDRENAGRSGSDILVAIVIMLVATQLRWLVGAAWLGATIDAGVAIRAFVHILTRTLTVDLGFLVVAAGVIFLASGRRRDLGRAFDLACVAALPLVFVELARVVVTGVLSISLSLEGIVIVSAPSYVWMAGLVWQAVVVVRHGSAATVERTQASRIAAWAFPVLAGVGSALQIGWIASHLDTMRPLQTGASAPAIALPRIGPRGDLGPRISLAPGRITVIDFWATWCNPCLASMPHLDEITRHHPEIDVLAINLDDPAEARALFDARGYAMTLLSDDGETSERYGVSAIPHTVVIDATGKLRRVARGGGLDLEAELAKLRAPSQAVRSAR